MFGLSRRLQTGLDWLEGRREIKRHPANGFLYQHVYGGAVYLRDHGSFILKTKLDRRCHDVYFREYMPQSTDTVVDIGAGYGHEALYCQLHSPGVRYISLEVQPSVYECLAHTIAPYRPKLRAFPLAISDEPMLCIDSARGINYEKVEAKSDAAVEIPTISWPAFLERFSISRVSLLKVNIEGGERQLLPALRGMDQVDRTIISAHDFRADRGHGENFRTRQFVMDYLSDAGFAPRSLKDVPWWRDWIYADRPKR